MKKVDQENLIKYLAQRKRVSKAEILRRAIGLYYLAYMEEAKGYSIGVVNKDKVVKYIGSI